MSAMRGVQTRPGRSRQRRRGGAARERAGAVRYCGLVGVTLQATRMAGDGSRANVTTGRQGVAVAPVDWASRRITNAAASRVCCVQAFALMLLLEG